LKKPVIIAAAVLLALLAVAGIILATNKKDSTPEAEASQPNVRIMEDTTTITPDPVEELYLRQIAELQSRIDLLEREKGQAEFDRTASQAEQDRLQKRLADLEAQIAYLRDRNNALNDEEQHFYGVIAAKDDEIVSRDEEIAALNEKIARLETERNAKDIAYQKALAQASEYRESLERRDRALTQAESPGQIHVNRRGDLVNTFNILPPGQSRNSLGIKFGNRNVNLDGSIALMPHWYLLGSLGIDQVHDDFVRDEFPGYDADNAFFYDVLMGTGLNWRFNRIQSQPNFYINTAVGPAWFLYKQDGEVELKTYFLWRSSVGFDLTLHKHLQFTGDIGMDWVQNYGFSPRFSLGVLWSFSHDWNIMGKK
jgi:hypothetical protein